jgi:hypothetical protein
MLRQHKTELATSMHEGYESFEMTQRAGRGSTKQISSLTLRVCTIESILQDTPKPQQSPALIARIGHWYLPMRGGPGFPVEEYVRGPDNIRVY